MKLMYKVMTGFQCQLSRKYKPNAVAGWTFLSN